MTEYGMGWKPRKRDERDWTPDSLWAMIECGAAVPVAWNTPVVLNQGQTNHCCGAAMLTLVISDSSTCPTSPDVDPELMHAIYYRAKEIDGHPGEENGTDLRSASKAAKEAGLLDAYAFGDFHSATKWVREKGPVVIGIPWYADMSRPKDGIIKPTGDLKGGHAICWSMDAMNPADNGLVNSWGRAWGIDGRCYLSDADLYQLLEVGEVCMAVKFVQPPPEPPTRPVPSNTSWLDRLRELQRKFFNWR